MAKEFEKYKKGQFGNVFEIDGNRLLMKDDPVVIQDDGSGNQVTASGRVLR